MPKDSRLGKSFEVTFEYKRSFKDTRYVLVKVEEDVFQANPQHFLNESKPALLAVKSLFRGWDSTPYAKFHIVGLIELALDPSSRADILPAGLETSEHKADFWLLAPGKNAKFWVDWKEEKIGSIGWDEVGDLGQFKSKVLIAEAVSEAYPEDGPKSVASMLWDFANEMKPGDIVFAKKGLVKVCGWGVVIGEYAYDDSREGHFHTLPIEWRGDNELTMPNGVQLALKTLTRVSTKRSFLRDMGKLSVHSFQYWAKRLGGTSQRRRSAKPVLNSGSEANSKSMLSILFGANVEIRIPTDQLDAIKSVLLYCASAQSSI